MKYKLLNVKLNLFRDYEKEMKEIESRGNLTAADYKQLASLEAERNAKIDSLNSSGTNQWNAQKTDKYSGWNTPDYSKSINSMIDSYENGGTYNQSALDQIAAAQTGRQNKASGTVGMGQYVNDDFDKYVTEWLKNQQQAPVIPDVSAYLGSSYSKLEKLAGELDDIEKPGYSSRWDPIKNDLADEALAYNYNDFLNSDTYNRLANRYYYNGNNAMKNTLGQVAARTGGLASSYAGSAAQQQFNDYMTRLEDAAYSMYNTERDNALENANTAWKYADNDYSRFLDAMDQYNKDRNFSYNALGDLVSQENWAQQMAYNVANNNYDRAVDRAKMMASTGDYSGYRNLGYTPEQVDQLNKAAAEAAAQPEEKKLTKPDLTWAQTKDLINQGIRSQKVLDAYEYYVGEPYGGGGNVSASGGKTAGDGKPKKQADDSDLPEEKDEEPSPQINDGIKLYNKQTRDGIEIPGHGDYTWSELADLEEQGKVTEHIITMADGTKYRRIEWVNRGDSTR